METTIIINMFFKIDKYKILLLGTTVGNLPNFDYIM